MVTKEQLKEHYTRCLTFNALEKGKYAVYKKYKYLVKDDKLWLEDIDVSPSARKLIIEPLFDVSNISFGGYEKYDKIKILDLGSISVLNQTLDESLFEIIYANKVKKIPSECFLNCINLKELHIDSCVSLGDYAFSGCDNLEKLTAEHVRFLGEYVFENSGIKVLKLGHTNINDYTFSHFYVLEELYMKSCNYCGMGSGLFLDTRILKYVDFGIFNDSKKHFWLLKNDSKTYYYLKNKTKEDMEMDLYCYESLFGKVKDGYFPVRNKELKFNSVFSTCEIHLELSKEIIDKNLDAYYLNYFSDVFGVYNSYDDYDGNRLRLILKVADQQYYF